MPKECQHVKVTKVSNSHGVHRGSPAWYDRRHKKLLNLSTAKKHQHKCQKNADTSKFQRFRARMTFIAFALRGMLEGAKERQKAYKSEYGQ